MNKEVSVKDLNDCLRVAKKYWKTGDVDYLGTLHENVEIMLREYEHNYMATVGVKDLIDACARKKYTLAKTKVGMNFLGFDVVDDKELVNPADIY